MIASRKKTLPLPLRKICASEKNIQLIWYLETDYIPTIDNHEH